MTTVINSTHLGHCLWFLIMFSWTKEVNIIERLWYRRQWLRNGEVLRETNDVLQVQGADVNALEGYYQCRVGNTWGTVISNKTLIRVARAASKREFDHPFNYDANVGMSLTLPCKIDNHGFPLPTVDDISWTRDGVDIVQDQRLHFTDTGASVFTLLR